MTKRNCQKQREPGTEGGIRLGYYSRQEQGTDQGAKVPSLRAQPLRPGRSRPTTPDRGEGKPLGEFVGN